MANNNSRRKKIGFVLLILVLCFIGSVIGYLRYRDTHIITDDAFIDGNVHYVTPQIPGKVAEVLVSDNQQVEKDQVLVKLDTADIEAQLNTARQNLDVVKNQVAGQLASMNVIGAQMRQLAAQRVYISKEKERISNLLEMGAVPANDYDKLIAQWDGVNAQIDAGRKQKRQIGTAVGPKGPDGKVAAIRLAEAQIAQLELQLDHAVIKAPIAGYVTRKSISVGQVIAAGQPIMAIVSPGDMWITANYKETDLTNVRPGQPVVFKVDTYPGVKFRGEVDSIMAGTGAVFSLLPPENATGNYIKVVQRIPVKIKITDMDNDRYPLRIGMSVVPTILVQVSGI